MPRTTFDGPALELDFPALHIGVAEYDEGPTGTTVFYFPKGATGAVDVRGGAPGTTYTDALRLGYAAPFVSAISFAGGSAYGLAAAGGVAAEIRDRTENPNDWQNIAVVPGAIIFDLGNRRFNTVTPDEALGRAALRVARPGRFPQGGRGAGRFAMQGFYYGMRNHSGQGGAFRQLGPTRVAVFVVANPAGTVVDRQGLVVRCGNDPDAPRCGSAADYLARTLESRTGPAAAAGAGGGGPSQNTTLTLVATNQKLEWWALQRLAAQVHASMARAIQPFHTEFDGDVLFAVTTGEVENPALMPVDLGVLASEVAWDAVLASVPALPPIEKTAIRLDAARLEGLAGTYELGQGTFLTVRRDGDRLLAAATGRQDFYGFTLDQPVELVPTSETHFLARNGRPDHLQFEGDASGLVTELVLNPGPWAVPARRMR